MYLSRPARTLAHDLSTPNDRAMTLHRDNTLGETHPSQRRRQPAISRHLLKAASRRRTRKTAPGHSRSTGRRYLASTRHSSRSCSAGSDSRQTVASQHPYKRDNPVARWRRGSASCRSRDTRAAGRPAGPAAARDGPSGPRVGCGVA